MNPPDLSKCSCTHCGGRIEFETDSAGQEVPCPHCGKPTMLYVDTAVPVAAVYEDPEAAKKEFRWMLFKIALCALAMVLLVLVGWWVKRHWQVVLNFLNSVFGVIFAGVCLVLGLAIYFAPSLVAYNRKKRNADAIFFLNLFLGWTFLGWVGSLIWATAFERPLVSEFIMGRRSTAALPAGYPDGRKRNAVYDSADHT